MCTKMMEMSADEEKKTTGAFPTLSLVVQFFILQREEIKGILEPRFS